ncbi:MAG: AAA family ATPase [Gemmatimonadaceae bacterium]|nr:AAA family ATPase [Gemmatimonadaceae bacterium]
MPAKKRASPAPQRLLRSLNLIGLDHLDGIVLAALCDERPLLLIGPHGTAKSELLNRLAAALDLSHRHYNASLISFDDLLGFPVPDAAGGTVRYLRTPADLWDAESVFLDEISRCRPETQNKLFSVVHEKRVQGLPLPKLRYRWAAMNPPLTAETDPEEGYEGSLALDTALADRFGYVVELPALLDLTVDDRLALIREGGVPPAEPADLAALVQSARDRLAEASTADREWAARYVAELVTPLAEARLAISGRRAVAMAGSVLAVYAASCALDTDETLSDCALVALRNALPQRAQGRAIDAAKLRAIHREALKAAGAPSGGPWRRIRALADPVARAAEAIRLAREGLDRVEVSELVAEAYASLGVPQRYLFARHVLPLAVQLHCLNAPTLDTLATPLQKVTDMCASGEQSFGLRRDLMPQWEAVTRQATRLARGGASDAQLANILLALTAVEHARFDVDELLVVDRKYAALFGRCLPVSEEACA